MWYANHSGPVQRNHSGPVQREITGAVRRGPEDAPVKSGWACTGNARIGPHQLRRRVCVRRSASEPCSRPDLGGTQYDGGNGEGSFRFLIASGSRLIRIRLGSLTAWGSDPSNVRFVCRRLLSSSGVAARYVCRNCVGRVCFRVRSRRVASVGCRAAKQMAAQILDVQFAGAYCNRQYAQARAV